MKPAEGSTVIGKSVAIKGELTGKEDLYLDGSFEGTVTLTEGLLTVGPNARVLADLNVQDLAVFGYIQGNIRVAGRLELRASAVVAGDIYAARMSIEENAALRGRVEILEPSGTAGKA
jgi:cytoskeletal protein CcmA (bactofilin family)